MEIGTGSSDNGNLRDESSGFDKVQRRSNESRDGYKRANESRSGGPERKVRKGSEHRVPKRNLTSNDTNSVLPRLRKKNRREETVTPTTSGYNLRPRKGEREETRLTIELKTQQRGPVRSRKGRERNYSPYIEERTRSSNKNARRGGDLQRQDQERRGTCTKKSLSLEVLIVRVQYFVRGGFVGHRSRASSKHLSPHFPVDELDSSGVKKGLRCRCKMHVWVSGPTKDAD
ncbi:uncharacterized protein TNCV_4142791 [Trichonephila clavipes]|nr:uncharacterized protein TNCV_4142791 [Trichonephila clavipes]